MAKKIVSLIRSPDDLVTSHEATRSGFVAMTLEKNYLASPYVEQAKQLKCLASQVDHASELLSIPELYMGLLAASGLSDKSLKYFTDENKTEAIQGLIKRFLEPAGDAFVEEWIYRFLLVKGDSLGGQARNLAGKLGEQKFIRAMISSFDLAGIHYLWLERDTEIWMSPSNVPGLERRVKALHWKKRHHRVLYLNSKVPFVTRKGKSVDLILLNCDTQCMVHDKDSILKQRDKYVALGELKGGIDPAGADEHWKTANSALERIRKSFPSTSKSPLTFFIGAAIETAMAEDIFHQIQKGDLCCAANLTNDEQLTMICQWLIDL